MNETDLLKSTRGHLTHADRKAARVGPYSVGEKQLLVELVGRARNTLRTVPTQMTADQYKQIWVDISNCMHANGWPRRSWKRLRMKAQSMMSCPMENGLVGQVQHDTPSSRLDQSANLCVSVSQQTVTNASRVSEPICSSIVSTPTPPRLLSSSEASAQTVMRLSNSICSSVGVANVQRGGGGGDGVPQILHFCSKAFSDGVRVDGFRRDTEFVSGPSVTVSSRTADGSTVLEVLNDDLLEDEDRIELCVSSDDESDEKLSENNESTKKDACANGDSEKERELNKMVVSRKPSSSPDQLADLTEVDFRRRMEIYDLKVEVLKLKRAYWTEKLRSL